MSDARASAPSHLRLLGRLDAQRLLGLARSPSRLAFTIGVPVVLVVSALAIFGSTARPSAEAGADVLAVSVLVSAVVSFLAYGVLFRGTDTAFLRRAGVARGALIAERAGRLVAAGMGVALAMATYQGLAGGNFGTLLLTGAGAAVLASGASVFALSGAARLMARGRGAAFGIGIQGWDPELARAGPLIYAPLLPFCLGAAYGVAFVVLGGTVAVTGALACAILSMFAGARSFVDAAPRFLPRAGEMAYTPPAEAVREQAPRRGIAAMLPGRAAAVWVRDATVAGRRYPWAARVSWPVAAGSVIVLARWGPLDASRTWVFASVGFALLIQGAAVVSLGLHERTGRRWIDRSAALAGWERFVGRFAWSFGLAAWLLIPVSLAWWWWSQSTGGWLWLVAGAITAAISTMLSLLTARAR